VAPALAIGPEPHMYVVASCGGPHATAHHCRECVKTAAITLQVSGLLTQQESQALQKDFRDACQDDGCLPTTCEVQGRSCGTRESFCGETLTCGPPCAITPGPERVVCFCNDGAQISACADGACGSFPGQAEVCAPVCESHGGSLGAGCFPADPACAAFPRQLVGLGPAQVWIGMGSRGDVGLRLDLLVEIFLNDAKIGDGQLSNIASGDFEVRCSRLGCGSDTALLQTVPLTLFAPLEMPPAPEVAMTVAVRRTCADAGAQAGTPRLWYSVNGVQSRLEQAPGAVIPQRFLTDPGGGLSIDIPVDTTTPCPARPFTPFGTWHWTLP